MCDEVLYASLLEQTVTDFVVQDSRFYLKGDELPIILRTKDKEWGGGESDTVSSEEWVGITDEGVGLKRNT